MIINTLVKRKLISPPDIIPTNTIYLVNSGSAMYGCSTKNSDFDVVGICIPRKTDIFPHLRGEIVGFGRQKQRFDQWQQHNIEDVENKKSYDFTIYSIVKYFTLAMEGNPNTIEILFAPRDCIMHSTPIAELMVENKKLFLHKGSVHKFLGYCYAQLTKAKSTTKTGSRLEIIKEFGYDTKNLSHVLRLLNECEQVLTTGDLDLRQISEQLKAVRNGSIPLEKVEEIFADKEKYLRGLYETSDKIPYAPDEEKIKVLLLKCLEMHYQDIGDCVVIQGKAEKALEEIRKIVERI